MTEPKPISDDPVDRLVKEYLSGTLTLADAMDRIPSGGPTAMDWFLRLFLPDDLFRHRMERISRRSWDLSAG